MNKNKLRRGRAAYARLYNNIIDLENYFGNLSDWNIYKKPMEELIKRKKNHLKDLEEKGYKS